MLRTARTAAHRIPRGHSLLRRTLIAQPVPPVVATSPLATTLSHGSEDAQLNAESMQRYIDELRQLRTKASEGGGKDVLEKWRKRGNGKLGARERFVLQQQQPARAAHALS